MNERVSNLSSDKPAVSEACQSRIPWLLVSLAPITLALASWDPAGARTHLQDWIRLFGVPALVLETGVFLYAVLSGTDPLRPLGRLPFWAKGSLLVLVLVGFATAFFVAPNTLRALSWTFCSIIHLVFGLAVARLVREIDSDGRLAIWGGIVIGLCAYLIVLILFVADALSKNSINWEFFGLGVTNIRQVGFYSAVGACASLGLAAVQNRGSRWTLLYIAVAVMMLALSFWSGTRGSLLAISVAFCIGALFLKVLRQANAWLMFAVAMIGGWALSIVGPVPKEIYGASRLTFAARGTVDVSSGRFDMWNGAWHAFLHRPLSGYGAGQYWPVVHDKLGSFNHPHNIILQLLFQWGLIGAACYVALGLLLLTRLLWALKRPEPADAPALLVLVSLLTMSLYEGSLFHTYPTLMVAFALSLIISPGRRGAAFVKQVPGVE
jgi:O-antigen ligase